ncbi:MAG: 2-phospho-L-lactate transferase [Terriglobia bacterium]
MIVVLTGGTGGAKFAQGLMQVVPQRELTFVVNTGDDLAWWGLPVSPDLDSIAYALAGMLSRERGWGVESDTFHCLDAMRRLGAPAWFQVGDRDLATHLTRARLLGEGRSLSEATATMARSLGVAARVLPMSDDRVETRVETDAGELGFEEYFVRERYQVAVHSVRFVRAAQAAPAPGVLAAIRRADAVLLAPSNPVTSLGPILAVAAIREALKTTSAPVGAVSPIVGGAAVSGPAAALMAAQGLPVSVAGVAQAYVDFLDLLVIDERDAAWAPAVEARGIQVHCAGTLMRAAEDKARVARAALDATLTLRAPSEAVP